MDASIKLINGDRLDGALGAIASAVRNWTGTSALWSWDMDSGFETQIKAIRTLIIPSETDDETPQPISFAIDNEGTTTVSHTVKDGDLTVSAFDTAAATSASSGKSIITNGTWNTTTTNAAGTYYGRVVVPNPNLIEVTVNATANTSVTISDSAITADHIVINEHQVMLYNVDYETTNNGTLILSCSHGIPAMTLYLSRRTSA